MPLQTGESQKQELAPLQATSLFVVRSMVKQASPEQQLPSLVQDCDTSEHEGGGDPQTPLMHWSLALQQGMEVAQDCPVAAQVCVGGGAAH